MKHPHPMIEAMEAVMIHLVGIAAMLNEGLGNDVRVGYSE